MSLRVVGYCRVSTDRQSISLTAQESKIRAMSSLKDATLIDVIVDSDASAKSLDRAGMAKLLRMVDTKAVDIVVICKLDRLTRSVKDLAELLVRFAKKNVSLISVEESLDTGSASGRLLLNIMVSVSQWEREAIGERTATALASQKSKGHPAGPAPYGWRSQGRTEPSAGKPKGDTLPLLEDEQEQAVLGWIRDARGAGQTLREIAAALNSAGTRTRAGGDWKHQYVAGVIGK